MSARPSDRLVIAIVDATPAIVGELGDRPFESARQAAEHLAGILPWGNETIRRALRDPRLSTELELLVAARPTARPTKSPTKSPSDPPDEKPQLSGPQHEADDEVAPYVSTTAPLSADPGPSQHPHPPVVHGRRPKEYRRSSFPVRCVVCSIELDAGRGYYLTPYDTGTVTACIDHAPLALAGAQLAYDVQRGRPVPEELELYIGRPQ